MPADEAVYRGRGAGMGNGGRQKRAWRGCRCVTVPGHHSLSPFSSHPWLMTPPWAPTRVPCTWWGPNATRPAAGAQHGWAWACGARDWSPWGLGASPRAGARHPPAPGVGALPVPRAPPPAPFQRLGQGRGLHLRVRGLAVGRGPWAGLGEAGVHLMVAWGRRLWACTRAGGAESVPLSSGACEQPLRGGSLCSWLPLSSRCVPLRRVLGLDLPTGQQWPRPSAP